MLVSFALGNANFSAFYPTGNLNVAFYLTRNPNASQWNIGCIGSLALGLMRSSRLGGPRAVTWPKAKPRAESRPKGHPNVMNACSTMEI